MTERTKEYQNRNTNEDYKIYMNKMLEQTEREIIDNLDAPDKPVLFIIGSPRSGTTLMHQLLARSGDFGYISNFIAMHWDAPVLGALRQRLYADRLQQGMSYESDLGRTKNDLDPHQFHYFWKKHLKNFSRELARELAGLERFFDKPMLFKSLHVGLHIKRIKTLIPTAKFIVMSRHPMWQAQSLLISRRKYFGNIEDWFSLKPFAYNYLKDKSPYEQVVGQIYYINKEISEGLDSIAHLDDSDTFIRLPYESLVYDPKSAVAQARLLADLEPNTEFCERKFENRSERKLSDDEWAKLVHHVAEYFGKCVPPKRCD